MGHRDVIVIGASAGGFQGVLEAAAALPGDFPASVLIVLHQAPTGLQHLTRILQNRSKLKATMVEGRQEIEHGHIYLPAPDTHLVVAGAGPEPATVEAGRGPRENGFRPSVDVLFRTAAAHLGARVIGVVLSGMLDDGVLGLLMVKRRGGTAIVQDPTEAHFSSMPSGAIEHVAVDHIVKVKDLASLLTDLTRKPLPMEAPVTPIPSMDSRKLLGLPASGFTCPECGGALWALDEGGLLHFRCHTGHGYSSPALDHHQRVNVEQSLWTAIRALQQRAEMQRRMADNAATDDRRRRFLEHGQEFDRAADAIREFALGSAGGAGNDGPDV